MICRFLLCPVNAFRMRFDKCPLRKWFHTFSDFLRLGRGYTVVDKLLFKYISQSTEIIRSVLFGCCRLIVNVG